MAVPPADFQLHNSLLLVAMIRRMQHDDNPAWQPWLVVFGRAEITSAGSHWLWYPGPQS